MADIPVLKRLLLVCVLAGLVLSVYAALETMFPGLQGTCTVNSYVQCAAVAQSTYSFIGPIPVWSLGVGGFVVLLLLSVQYMRADEVRWLFWIWLFAVIGVLASVVLLAVEVVLIHAICPVCIASYVADGAVLAVAWKLRRETSAEPRPSPAA